MITSKNDERTRLFISTVMVFWKIYKNYQQVLELFNFFHNSLESIYLKCKTKVTLN